MDKACDYRGDAKSTAWVIAWAMHGGPPPSSAFAYTAFAQFLQTWDEGTKEALRLDSPAVRAAIAQPIFFWSGDRADLDWKSRIPEANAHLGALRVAADFVSAALGEVEFDGADLRALEDALVEAERTCQELPEEDDALRKQLLADFAEMRLLIREYAIHGNNIFDRIGRIAAHASMSARAAGKESLSGRLEKVWQRSHESAGLASNLMQIGTAVLKALPSGLRQLLPPGIAE
jgi:hypothetical protein